MPATRSFLGEPHFLKNIHPFRKIYRLLQIVSLKFHDVYNLFPMNITLYQTMTIRWTCLVATATWLGQSNGRFLVPSASDIGLSHIHNVMPSIEVNQLRHSTCKRMWSFGVIFTIFSLGMSLQAHYNLQFCYPQNISQHFSLLNNTLDCHISVSN